MSKLLPLTKNKLPKPLGLKKLIGPSFILLGLGLGSGELILWPYLSSNYGLGVMWAAVLGITFQFFLNMEIERYTIVNGESIFVGLTRKYGRLSPVWFILSTLVPWIWPGIAAASATVFAKAMGIDYSGYVGIAVLLIIGIFLSLGSVVYKTQEKVQKIIILVGIPFVFLLTLFFAKSNDWVNLAFGLVGRGNNFLLLPAGIPIATFLGAFAYAGAGGNLNLSQSLYAKEKGYGMGKYSGKLTNILRGTKNEKEVMLEGSTFDTTEENLSNFRIWWKRLNIEHGIVFWATGAITMLMLSLLAYATVYGNSGIEEGITFVLQQADFISQKTFSFVGVFFLSLVGVMLFGTQFSVFGSTSRIMAENLVIFDQKRFKINNLSKYFYVFLWLQILAGIIIFSVGFTQPLALVVTSAVLNAFSMFVYSGLILFLNTTNLAKPLRPSPIRIIIVGAAFLFYGAFSIYTIYQKVFMG